MLSYRPRGAMGPARNRRRFNWPVPIAPRGGPAEVAQKFYFLITATGGPYSDLGLPTTKIENGIIPPPPPRRAMGPDRNCRQLNCPVPIAHRGGGGSAEVALEAALSYKLPRADRILIRICPQQSLKYAPDLRSISYKKKGEAVIYRFALLFFWGQGYLCVVLIKKLLW